MMVLLAGCSSLLGGFQADGKNEVLGLDMMNEGDVRISEVMADPDAVSDSEGEWVELTNVTVDKTFELQGLIIRDEASEGAVQGSVILRPGTFVSLARGTAETWSFDGFVPAGYYGEAPALNNDGETLSIAVPDGALPIDTVTLGQAGMGVSTQQDEDGLWCDATTPIGSSDERGTPGSANSSCSSNTGTCGIDQLRIKVGMEGWTGANTVFAEGEDLEAVAAITNPCTTDVTFFTDTTCLLSEIKVEAVDNWYSREFHTICQDVVTSWTIGAQGSYEMALAIPGLDEGTYTVQAEGALQGFTEDVLVTTASTFEVVGWDETWDTGDTGWDTGSESDDATDDGGSDDGSSNDDEETDDAGDDSGMWDSGIWY